ncbi:hypothetical protein ACJMK2_012074 [Sinanodonta woodiana]|uniref:2'-phosphotransferase n=1 Tax=Sinanodonta woodiana TaxID=1069815 RepID=A0ABD3V713_SINWO
MILTVYNPNSSIAQHIQAVASSTIAQRILKEFGASSNTSQRIQTEFALVQYPNDWQFHSDMLFDSEARQTMRTKTEQTSRQKLEAEKNQERLRKRLCYLLRYGAMKEGLKVYDGGYVALDDAMKLHLMKWNREEEVMHEVKTSLSSRGTKRFQEMEKDGRTYIRAAYYRMFERNPCHEATNVPTLLETSLEFVTSNIEMYDLQNFPDEYLIRKLLMKGKTKPTTKLCIILLIKGKTKPTTNYASYYL